MMSVTEISKRRLRFKRTPPGFPHRKESDINNNYSIPTNEHTGTNHMVQGVPIVTIDPLRMSAICSNGAKDFPAFLQTLRSNSNVHVTHSSERVGVPCHMMPVVDVARKRAKDHVAPPGFRQLPVLDSNNNARKPDKKSSQANQPVTYKSSKAAPNFPLKVGHTFAHCIKAMKSEIFLTREEMESLKPQCLKGEDAQTDSDKKVAQDDRKSGKDRLKGGLQTMKSFPKKLNFIKGKKNAPGRIFEESIRKPDVVGGEMVVLNVLTFDPEEQCAIQDVQARDLTPENFLETFEHYEMVTETRKNMTRIAYTLGDLLSTGDLKGDQEEWTTFNEVLLEEERAWKKKCREDDEFFERHGRSMGEKPSRRTRMREFFKDTISRARTQLADVCPCIF